MKITSWFILISVLVLFACEPLDAPEFRKIEGLKFKLINSNAAEVNANVVLFNTNDRKVKLKNVDLVISVDGIKAATINRDYNLVIKPESEFTVPVSTKVSLKELNGGLLNTAISIFTGSTKDVLFEGTARVKAYGFSFRVPIEYKDEVRLRM
jgi:LEA14-like dessication related protein